jgi:hypothetical protein
MDVSVKGLEPDGAALGAGGAAKGVTIQERMGQTTGLLRPSLLAQRATARTGV